MKGSGERFDPFEFELDSDQHSVIDLLAGEQSCPLCGCPYDETRVVREREGVITLAVQCHCCGTGSLITIENESRPVAATHLEFTPVEQAFFASLRPIGEEDVRRMRALLKKHWGDLRELL